MKLANRCIGTVLMLIGLAAPLVSHITAANARQTIDTAQLASTVA